MSPLMLKVVVYGSLAGLAVFGLLAVFGPLIRAYVESREAK